MRRRLQLALLAGLAVALTAAMTASAKSNLRLTEAGGTSFPDRAFVLALPGEHRLSKQNVHVLENGSPVGGVSVVPVGAAGAGDFGVVLVVDASLSMQGEPERVALSAARTFAEQRSPRQQLAVVTYNRVPSVLLPFTTSRDKIGEALSRQPKFAFGTHIYDAVVKALDLVDSSHIGVGSIIVLSDGREHAGREDSAKHETERSAVAAARAAHVRVFTVGLRSSDSKLGALEKLAAQTNGRYVEARSLDALEAIYNELGSQLAHEYLLRYRSPAEAGTKVWVTVKVEGISTELRSGYATLALSPPAAGSFHRGLGDSFWGSPFTMIVFSFLAVGLVAFCGFVLLQPRRRTVQKRLAEFIALEPAPEGKSAANVLQANVFSATEKSLASTGWWRRFLQEVEIAEIEMNPIHIVFWTLAGTLAAMWAFAIFFTFVAALFGLLVPMAVYAVIRRKAEKKRNLFGDQLPDNLAVLASALRAGHSLVGALSLVVEDAPEPAASEFRRVIADERLGRPLDEALEVVVVRMRSSELAQVALVAALQRETGGSTSEVLDRVVETVRERQELRRLVRTLTAAGRLSRWVVTFLPIALMLAISVLNPGYLGPLFDRATGRILFVLAVMLVIGGSYVIKRIVDIKV